MTELDQLAEIPDEAEIPEVLVMAITEGEWSDAAEIFYRLSIDDVTDIIANLDGSFSTDKECVSAKILELVAPSWAASVFVGLDSSLALFILHAMDNLEHVLEIIYSMGPQGAADLFGVTSGQWEEDPVSSNFVSFLNGRDPEFAKAVVGGLTSGRADYLRSIGGKF